jgi:hypothetical protein
VDLLEAKTRVAEALVESIFRRARYEIRPWARATGAPLRIGRDDFSPHFGVKAAGDGAEYLIEVRYHPHIEQFLAVESQRAERSLFQMARRQWPDLHFVLVTDRPESDRSCFQVVPLSTFTPGTPCRSVDLAALEEFGIFAHNVSDHEELSRRIFALLSGA